MNINKLKQKIKLLEAIHESSDYSDYQDRLLQNCYNLLEEYNSLKKQFAELSDNINFILNQVNE